MLGIYFTFDRLL